MTCDRLGSTLWKTARGSLFLFQRNRCDDKTEHKRNPSLPIHRKEQRDMTVLNYTSDVASDTKSERRAEKSSMSSRAETVGRELARYGLVVVIAWIGLMKLTAYEAEGISPL